MDRMANYLIQAEGDFRLRASHSNLLELDRCFPGIVNELIRLGKSEKLRSGDEAIKLFHGMNITSKDVVRPKLQNWMSE
jgi:hypothetical protein